MERGAADDATARMLSPRGGARVGAPWGGCEPMLQPLLWAAASAAFATAAALHICHGLSHMGHPQWSPANQWAAMAVISAALCAGNSLVAHWFCRPIYGFVGATVAYPSVVCRQIGRLVLEQRRARLEVT